MTTANETARTTPAVVVTMAWNKGTGVFEAIDREPYTPGMEFAISAGDVGCKVGDIFRASVRNADDVELYQVEVKAS